MKTASHGSNLRRAKGTGNTKETVRLTSTIQYALVGESINATKKFQETVARAAVYRGRRPQKRAHAEEQHESLTS